MRSLVNLLIPCGTGLVFIVAACLKAHETFVTGNDSLLSWKLFLICFEVTLGLFLLAGLCGKRVRIILFALVTVFAIHSVVGIVNGQQDCGCLGALTVHPLVSLMINCVMLFSVALWNPETRAGLPGQGQTGFMVTSGYCSMICIALPILLVSFNHNTLVLPVGQPGPELMAGQVVRLDPESWPGNYPPVLDQIESPAGIHEGTWMIVLYRDGCDRCEQSLSDAISLVGEHERILVISLNSGPDAASTLTEYFEALDPNMVNRQILFRSTDRSIVWLFAAPTWLKLANGKVVTVGRKLADIAR